jgi:FlaG/FlaF family flagellin (archaellin)
MGNDEKNNSSVVACVFTVAVTILLSSCLSRIKDTHTVTELIGGNC